MTIDHPGQVKLSRRWPGQIALNFLLAFDVPNYARVLFALSNKGFTLSNTPRSGPVERATRAELRRLGVSVQEIADAALAVSLARQIDSAKGAASAALAAKQQHDIMAALRVRAAEEKPARTGIDELRARRAAAG